MGSTRHSTIASLTIAELREFASFGAKTQRYIKRSLDVGLARHDAFSRWSRDASETSSIRMQYLVYQDLKKLRNIVPQGCHGEGVNDFVARLLVIAAFDLSQEKIDCFSGFRFLYERLISPDVRRWLPSAFCAAAALPQIQPPRRKMLLQSISEAAATAPGWSDRPPVFYPEWVDDVHVIAS